VATKNRDSAFTCTLQHQAGQQRRGDVNAEGLLPRRLGAGG